jgi:hypothetical protein
MASDGILQFKQPPLPPYRGPAQEDLRFRSHVDHFLTLDHLLNIHPDQLILFIL